MASICARLTISSARGLASRQIAVGAAEGFERPARPSESHRHNNQSPPALARGDRYRRRTGVRGTGDSKGGAAGAKEPDSRWQLPTYIQQRPAQAPPGGPGSVPTTYVRHLIKLKPAAAAARHYVVVVVVCQPTSAGVPAASGTSPSTRGDTRVRPRLALVSRIHGRAVACHVIPSEPCRRLAVGPGPGPGAREARTMEGLDLARPRPGARRPSPTGPLAAPTTLGQVPAAGDLPPYQGRQAGAS
ncbi:hypothetical protein CDD83_1202 [Cordyceps sp. RAO-2017]|nr:hypothetical protein CDD83_1202 [Cordyceps sp. RAO-2017]